MATVTWVGGDKFKKRLAELEALNKKKFKKTIRYSMSGGGSTNFQIDTSMEGGDDIGGTLQRAHREAMKSLQKPVGDYLDAMMRASWGWTDGVRDIVDTGDLMSSQKITVSGDDIMIDYSADYAGITHYGGYIQPYGNVKIAKVYIPGRPWISATFGLAPGPLPPFNFEEAYVEAYYRALR